MKLNELHTFSVCIPCAVGRQRQGHVDHVPVHSTATTVQYGVVKVCHTQTLREWEKKTARY